MDNNTIKTLRKLRYDLTIGVNVPFYFPSCLEIMNYIGNAVFIFFLTEN